MRALSLIAAALAVAANAAFAGGLSGGDVAAVPSSIDARLGIQTSAYHSWTDAEYMRPRLLEARDAQGIAMLFRGDTSSVRILALSDSIANGTGTWADSTAIAGETVTFSVYVDPDSVAATRLGAWPTIEEVLQLNAAGIEIVSTTSEDQTLSWDGLVSGARVAGAGHTGMSREFLLALFQSYQDAAQGWGIPDGFRSHRWRREQYQLGIGSLLRQRGYYQAFRMGQHPQNLQDDADSTESYAEDQPNYWQFASARLARGGADRFAGYHSMGEPTNDFNLGLRRWNCLNGAHGDSVTAFFDGAFYSFSVAGFVHDGAVEDSASSNDMSWATLRKLFGHAAHRQAEGGFGQAWTVEGLATVRRAVRTGDFLPHRNFTVLASDTTYTNGAIPSLLTPGAGASPVTTINVPIGWSAVDQHYVGGGDRWAVPGTDVSGITQPVVYRVPVDGDSITASYVNAFGNSDSVSAGLGTTAGNVVMQKFWQTQSIVRPLGHYIITMGHDCSGIEITGQFLLNATFTADSALVYYKFQQSRERVDDFLNEGPSAYQLPVEFAHFGQAPDTTNASGMPDSLLQKTRIIGQAYPSFLAMVDTTFATGWMSELYAADERYPRDLMIRNPPTLIPAIRAPIQGSDMQWQSTIGNMRPDGTTHAIRRTEIVDHETVIAHVEKISEAGRIYSFIIRVHLDPTTCYVSGYTGIDSFAGSFASGATVSWLDFGVRGI